MYIFVDFFYARICFPIFIKNPRIGQTWIRSRTFCQIWDAPKRRVFLIHSEGGIFIFVSYLFYCGVSNSSTTCRWINIAKIDQFFKLDIFIFFSVMFQSCFMLKPLYCFIIFILCFTVVLAHFLICHFLGLVVSLSTFCIQLLAQIKKTFTKQLSLTTNLFKDL